EVEIAEACAEGGVEAEAGESLDIDVAGDLPGDDGEDVVSAGDAVVAVGEEVAVDLPGLVAAGDHGEDLGVGEAGGEIEEGVSAVGGAVDAADLELAEVIDAGDGPDLALGGVAVDVDGLLEAGVDGRSAVVSVAEGADLQEVQALDEVIGVDGLEELAIAAAPEGAALVEELLEAI